MRLSQGTRLGRYEIVAPVGAGGMGKVYRALDTQLQRDVAVKVIADRFDGRADLRERFRVEAMAVAALNHPNICQVYDAGVEAGVDFIVMEFIEGETLAARLKRKPVAPDDALRIGRELAAALAAAHRAGIVHRDVKPLNVMLTRTGAKLMDFGLARITAPAPIDPSESTITPRELTEPGSPLGTWQYMSPEQLQGGRSDARSDVFAFGAVLFEMMAGRPAFSGASHVELVESILESQVPPLDSVSPGVPAPISSVVRTCLQKDPQDRWQTGGDLERALGMVSALPPTQAVGPRLMVAFVAAAAIVAVGAAALVGLPLATGRSGTNGIVRAELQVGPEYLAHGDGALALSADGRTVFYDGGPGAPDRGFAIYRRDLSVDAGTPVMGTNGGRTPCLSPDGRWIAFRRGSTLVKVPATGGAPTDLATLETPDFWGISWGSDGTLVVGSATGLWLVPETGGAATRLTRSADDGDFSHAWPQALPGGHALLFGITPGPTDDSRVVVLDRRSGERKELLRGVSAARYVATGHLAYVKDGALWTVPFDLDTRSIGGEPARLAQNVIEYIDGAPEFAFSAAGDVAFIAGPNDSFHSKVGWVDMNGRFELIEAPPGQYGMPQVSPDGSRISLTVLAGRSDVWTYDVPRGAWTRSTPGRYQSGPWSPDGREQIFVSPRGIVRRTTDGAGTEQSVFATGVFPYKWSPRGDAALVRRFVDGQSDLFSLDLSSKTLRPITSTPVSEDNASYSPDGRWIVFSSTDTGRGEIYIQSVDGAGRHQVTSTGALQALWARDGKHIYYRSRAATWAVPVATAPAVSIGTPRKLFDTQYVGENRVFGGTFDVMPDGKRFVMTTVPTSRFHTIGLVLNGLPPVNR